MTTKTLATAGQSKYTSGYRLGSDSNTTNTGVTLVNRGTVGATASQWAVEIYGSGNTVMNYGVLNPTGTGGPPAAGIAFATGNNDVAINEAGATLASSDAGFYAGSNSAGRATNLTLINGGLIQASGAAYEAVVILDSGIVSNLSTGTIVQGINFYSGTANGATPTSNVSVVNSGEIFGGPTYGAIYMLNGGNVTNLAGGTISGNSNNLYGIRIANKNGLNTASTITNGGTIEGNGTGNSITLSSVSGNRIIDKVGGVFLGIVNGGSNATMELASTASSGILLATGGQFTNFSNLVIDAGDHWTIHGDSALSTEFPLIGGFAGGDVILLTGLAQNSTTFVSSVATVSGTAHTSVTIKANSTGLETLTLLGSMSSSQFTFTGGATTTLTSTACFLTGTHIATADGPRPVEALRIGELVQTQAGDARPIRWIGHRSVDPGRHPRPAEVQPIRIAPDAFGPGLPERALFVSPDHGIRVPDVDNGEAVLVPAGLLANGDRIASVDRGPVTYWHVELDTHDIILAEGLPVESYLDAGNRDDFADPTVPIRLHPDFSPPSNAWLWEVSGCLRIVLTGPLLAAARRQVGRDNARGPGARPRRTPRHPAPGKVSHTAA